MHYYIGVDGGGTKTELALFDENKNILDSVKVAGSNHENLAGSFEEAADIIMSGLSLLLSSANLSFRDIEGILMGLAGIDHPYQHDALSEILTRRGLMNFRIYNDGFIVTKAGLANGVGIGYNCGTGTCCNSIDSDGKMLQIGGFSELSNDMGNGHWIATCVFQKLYDDLCLGLYHTKMSEIFCYRSGISKDAEGLLSTLSAFDEEDSAEEMIRLLIDVFFAALNEGDNSAEEICDRMAERGAEYICTHLRRQNFKGETVHIVLSGSIHTKLPSDRYIEKLKQKCAELSGGRSLEFIRLNKPPVIGCINWLLEK